SWSWPPAFVAAPGCRVPSPWRSRCHHGAAATAGLTSRVLAGPALLSPAVPGAPGRHAANARSDSRALSAQARRVLGHEVRAHPGHGGAHADEPRQLVFDT